MRLKTFFMVTMVALLSLSTQAKLEFYGNPTEEWKDSAKSAEETVISFLGDSFPYPKRVRVYYTPDVDISFSITKNVLIIGEMKEPLFWHEYAHALLDDYLFTSSPGWFYHRIKSYLKGKDLQMAIVDTQERVDMMKETVEEFIREGRPEKYIKNLQKTIASNSENIGFFKKALEDEPLYKAAYENVDMFKIVLPYHELFADSMTVLMTQDFSLMERASREAAERRGDQIVVPEGATLEDVFAQRSFYDDLSPESFSFPEWYGSSAYTQFPLVKSYLKEISMEFDHSKIVRSLFEVVREEYEAILLDSNLWNLSLMEKNVRVIERLEKKLR